MFEVAGLQKYSLQEKGIKGFEYAMEYLSKKNNLSKVTQIINKAL